MAVIIVLPGLSICVLRLDSDGVQVREGRRRFYHWQAYRRMRPCVMVHVRLMPPISLVFHIKKSVTDENSRVCHGIIADEGELSATGQPRHASVDSVLSYATKVWFCIRVHHIPQTAETPPARGIYTLVVGRYVPLAGRPPPSTPPPHRPRPRPAPPRHARPRGRRGMCGARAYRGGGVEDGVLLADS